MGVEAHVVECCRAGKTSFCFVDLDLWPIFLIYDSNWGVWADTHFSSNADVVSNKNLNDLCRNSKATLEHPCMVYIPIHISVYGHLSSACHI